MKRILLLTLLLASTMAAFAQGGGSLNDQRRGRPTQDQGGTSIRVKLSTNQMVAVSVDDRYYEKRGTSLTVGNIPAGKHYLKVYNYHVGRSGNGRANVVYSGYVVLKNNSFNMCIVDPYQRKMTMRTTQTFDRDDNDQYQNWNDNRDDQNYNNNSYSNAMRNQDVTELGVRVKDRMMDGDKEKLMQSVLANKTYYVEQLRTMMSWLSFESTKLEFAKWAYDNTIDKDNYWKLEDVFSFSSSKNELTEYVQQKGPAVRVNDHNDQYIDDRNGYKDDRNRDNYENNNVNPNAVSDRDITELGARVKDRIGDSDKQKLVQSVLNGKQYYTQQVRTMIGWFSFESTKLDLAKWAYGGTIDKDNYWKLEDVFSFSSSKDELNAMIQGKK